MVCAPSNFAVNRIGQTIVGNKMIFPPEDYRQLCGPIFAAGNSSRFSNCLVPYVPQYKDDFQILKNCKQCLVFSTLIHCEDSLYFDLIVIDEASSCSEIETLKPFAHDCSTFVLLGDPNQLIPVIKWDPCKNVGYQRSFFERYQILKQKVNDNSIITLSKQYRMRSEIFAFSLNRFYGNQIQTPPEVGQNNKILLPPITCFDLMDSKEGNYGGSKINEFEVKFISSLVEDILSKRIN